MGNFSLFRARLLSTSCQVVRKFTYAHVCSRMLTYSDVLYQGVRKFTRAPETDWGISPKGPVLTFPMAVVRVSAARVRYAV